MTIPASDVVFDTTTNPNAGALPDYVGFPSHAAFVAWALGKKPALGVVIHAGGLAYRFTDSGTYLVGLPGWVPEGIISPSHFATNTTPGATDMTSAVRRAFDYLIDHGGVIDGRCEEFGVWGQVNLPGRSNVRCLRCTFIAINNWDPELPVFKIAATSRDMTFEDCVIEGSHKANGWLIDNAATVHILRCRVHGVPDYAVRSQTKATELRIEGCDFRQWNWNEGEWNVAARRTAKLIDLATVDYMVMRNVCAYAKECIST
ncbi:hypothetical protein [Stagnihabitans tardus]|uniref:Uncharacterized protein n=1 Tax=Stagnihabitans tardus TaxID=2699202 RepID=A0AAE4Y889_9RHOB|nr:hypothetical protein [Stagnihabitans tardus]NBZ86438.1 hypothetical protein [Stagnihabitans tardus]